MAPTANIGMPNQQTPVFGVPRANPIAGILNTIRPFALEARNFRLQDQQRANDMASVRPDRVRNMFGQPDQPNVVFNPGITDFQKESLALDRQKLAVGDATDRAKLAQDKDLGEGRLALNEGKLALDTEKNKNIYETKLKELDQRATEAEKKLEFAQQVANSRNATANDMLNFRQAQLEATKAQHEAENARRDAADAETKRMNDARIKQIQDAADAAGYSISESEVNEDGTRKTTVTKKGSQYDPNSRVPVIGPNGETGTVTAEESKSLPKGWKVK